MIKIIFKVIKKIILAGLIVYGYNVLALPLSISVPINIVTIVFVCCFDFVGLFGLIIFKYMFF